VRPNILYLHSHDTPPGAEFNDPDQVSPGEPTHVTAPLSEAT
jgi:hypothetical protein